MSANGDRPLRILLLIPILGAGGAETQLVNLAIGLAEAGHEVTLAAMVAVMRDVEPLRRAGVRVVDLHCRTRARKPLALPRMIALARRADVVHCGLWDVTLWGRIAAIAEHSGGREIERSLSSGASRAGWIRLHNRLLGRFTFAWLTTSRWQAGMLEQEGVDPSRVVHVPNAVHVDELRAADPAALREELAIPPETRVVVHVARLDPVKNHRLSLDAVAALREDVGDVRLLIAGDGPERAALERHAAELGAAGWATFLGTRGDVGALFAAADLAVLPSTVEGLPMSLLEAIGAGTPVVATEVGDVGWVLETTGAGLAVPPGDADAFVDACRRVLSDDELRARLADSARASRHFDAPPMVLAHERLFRAAAAGDRVPDAAGAPTPSLRA